MNPLQAVRAKLFAHRYAMWLGVLMLLYGIVSVVLSLLRGFGFYTTNWDLGIFQQAMWSTTHGKLLWEAGDYEFYGVQSFLQVHPAPLVFALVPFYALAPTALTLFVIQSAVVAIAALPLAELARELSGSTRNGLVAAGLYLCQAAVLGANLYDFHMEAFLPLEMFLLVLFWTRERYLLVVVVSILTIVTLEVGPILVGAFGLYCAAPWLGRLVQRAARRLQSASSGAPSAGETEPLRGGLTRFGLVFAIALMIASAVAYVGLRVLQYDVMPAVLGIPQGGASLANLANVGMSLDNLGSGFPEKLTYWLIIFVMVGFLPFRAPRTLLMTLPWFTLTFLEHNPSFSVLGFQYGFVAEATLMVGVAFGLRDLQFPGMREILRAWIARVMPKRQGHDVIGGVDPGRRTMSRWALVVTGAIALNLALSPANPLMQFGVGGSGYRLTYAPAPGYSEVVSLAQLIPPDGAVLACPDVFPFVANNVNAYSLLWYPSPPPFLPFNASNLPTFVLISQDQIPTVPLWLGNVLYSALYGIRGVVWQSPVGTVLLFERNWTGTYAVWLPLPGGPAYYWGNALNIGPAASVVPASNAPFPDVIQTNPNVTGTAWYGPYNSLAPGRYTMTMVLSVRPEPGVPSLQRSQTFLVVQVGSFGYGNWVDQGITLADLSGGNQTQLKYTFTVTSPVTNIEFRGFQVDTGEIVTLFYILMTPQ